MSVRFTVTVEIALGADISADPATWTWTDITSYVYIRDGGITITRGRQDEQSQAQPQSCTLLLNNRDGRFSRLNPSGAYYGQLTKNTPLRVRADPSGGAVTRFVGFVSEWPPRWDKSGNDMWVTVRADGALRRLGQDAQTLRSPMYRTISSPGANSIGPPIAYWPLEDGSIATHGGAVIGGENFAVTIGTVTFGGGTPPAGSDSLVQLSTDSQIIAPVDSGSSTGGWTLGFLIKIPTAITSGSEIAAWFTSGTVRRWAISLATGSPDTITLTGTDASGASVISSTSSFESVFTLNEWYDYWLYMFVAVKESGPSLDVSFAVYDATESTINGLYSSTLSSTQAGSINRLAFAAGSGTDSLILGHVAIWDRSLPDDDALTQEDVRLAIMGFDGELTAARVSRLCTDAAVQVTFGGSSSSAIMGPQQINTFLGLLRDAEAAENGLLLERTTGELGFDRLDTRLNATAALTLNYASSHVSDLAPTDDDQLTGNDWTVTRTGGASARVTDDTTLMGTDPTVGVGRYAKSTTVNVWKDSDAADQAGWRVNIGTVNQYRYPILAVMLHNPNLSALKDTIATVDISDRITIQNLPTNLPPDDVDLIVEGYTEVINSFEWNVVFNCSPYKPYNVLTLADTTADQDAGRLSGDEKAAIRAAISSSDLSMDVDPNFYRWTTDADDFDPDLRIRLGGEVVQVSGISTTAGTFVAAGSVSFNTNAAVSPALYAGATANDLILVFAAIGTDGTSGTLATPTGYTRLPVFGSTENVQLFAKVHSGSESNPTVTPSGGGASDLCAAVTFGLRGTSCTLEDLTDVVIDSATLFNSSAQNVLYPGLYPRYQEGCVVLALAWKRHSWTSVATLSGFTEAVDSSSATGNETGLAVDYVIQTTPAVVNEGSFTVTGGASTVSRAALVAIASGYQTFTISNRSINGVTKSHAAATKIEVEDPLVLSL